MCASWLFLFTIYVLLRLLWWLWKEKGMKKFYLRLHSIVAVKVKIFFISWEDRQSGGERRKNIYIIFVYTNKKSQNIISQFRVWILPKFYSKQFENCAFKDSKIVFLNLFGQCPGSYKIKSAIILVTFIDIILFFVALPSLLKNNL